MTHPSPLVRHDMPVSLTATILRDREVLQSTLTTFPTEKTETSRFILFCGALIQQPYLSVRQRVSTLWSDVFVAGRIEGSPFERFGVKSRSFITHVNSVSTPTLDAFLEEIGKIEDNKYFRLTGTTIQNTHFVKTLKRDEHYFPLTEYQRNSEEPSGWRTTVIKS
jgi:hypothetical protein